MNPNFRCGYLNSTLNPILYPLCNKNFKIAFKRMLRTSSSNERDSMKIKPDMPVFKRERINKI